MSESTSPKQSGPAFARRSNASRKSNDSRIGKFSENKRRLDLFEPMLRIIEQVAWKYEREQLEGRFPEGQTWLTIHHDIGQAARVVLSRASSSIARGES